MGRATSDVSVIIPVRNGALHIGEAIRSAVAQPETYEIVVVDDGSTDDTAAVVAALDVPQLRYVRQEPSSAAAARNRGAALAAGPLLAFLDADDLWLPGKLAAQRAALAAGAGELVFTLIEEFLSPELSAGECAALRPHAGPMRGISPVTLLLRRADFARVGPFDVTARTGDFVDWYARAQELGLTTHVVPELLARRRLHRGNHGRSPGVQRQAYAGILRDVLARRRAAADE